MSVSFLPIYVYNHPILRKKARPVRRVDEALVKLVDDMFETMHTANGIGLAANQVGSLQRVIVVDISGMEESKDPVSTLQKEKPRVLLNPEVVFERDKWVMEEGCLSIPDIREEVERAESIRVHYKDLEFNDQVLEAGGVLGRVILHEIDHLNGVLFIDRLGSVKRKLLRGRLNKVARGEIEVSYPVVTPVSVLAEVA
jgi:peptide deformylase